ncbi:uncharacterized protein V6R79_016490 [Siganus canaliculatus]
MQRSGDKSVLQQRRLEERHSYGRRLLRESGPDKDRIALGASKAQIIPLRLVGSQQFVPSSVLDLSNCLTFKETLPVLDFCDNLPLWMEFRQADRWKNMQPGSSQREFAGQSNPYTLTLK